MAEKCCATCKWWVAGKDVPDWGHCKRTVSLAGMPWEETRAYALSSYGLPATLLTISAFLCCQYEARDD